MSMYEGRVAKGAALLDRVMPEWASQIDTDELVLTNVHYCILGQLFGSFATGLEGLFETETEGWSLAPEYGFNLTQQEWDVQWYDDADVQLENYWIAEINKRAA